MARNRRTRQRVTADEEEKLVKDWEAILGAEGMPERLKEHQSRGSWLQTEADKASGKRPVKQREVRVSDPALWSTYEATPPDGSRRAQTGLQALMEALPHHELPRSAEASTALREPLEEAMADIIGPEDAELVARRYLAQMTVRELAAETNATLASMEHRLRRAVAKLNEEMPNTPIGELYLTGTIDND